MRRRDCKRRCSPDRNVALLITCPVGHEKLHLIEKDKKTQKPYSIRERLRRGLSAGLRIRLRATVKQTRHNFFYRLTRSCIVTIRGVSEEKKRHLVEDCLARRSDIRFLLRVAAFRADRLPSTIPRAEKWGCRRRRHREPIPA